MINLSTISDNFQESYPQLYVEVVFSWENLLNSCNLNPKSQNL